MYLPGILEQVPKSTSTYKAGKIYWEQMIFDQEVES